MKEIRLERSNALGFVRQFGISPVKNTSQFPGMSNQQLSRSLEPGQMGSPRSVGPLPFLAHTIKTWNHRFLWPHICLKRKKKLFFFTFKRVQAKDLKTVPLEKDQEGKEMKQMWNMIFLYKLFNSEVVSKCPLCRKLHVEKKRKLRVVDQ